MQLTDWIPGLSSAALLAVGLWLARNVISTRLTKSVEFEFNKKLEELRAEQRKAEENLKAEIRTKEAQITALQSGALAAMVSRQQAFDKRRLEAVDQIWSAVQALAPARVVATYMALIKWESAAAEAERDPQARKLFEMLGQNADPKSIDQSMAHKARPFVTTPVWAAYSAFSAVCMHGVLRQVALRHGMGAKEFADLDAINKLVVATLPHYKDYIAEHGSFAYFHAIPALEEKLLADIQAMLRGSEGDVESIARASTIINLANQVAQSAE
jgi:hypothetical protein